MRGGAEDPPTLANRQVPVGDGQKAVLDLKPVEHLLGPSSPGCGSIQGEHRAPVRNPAEGSRASGTPNRRCPSAVHAPPEAGRYKANPVPPPKIPPRAVVP